MGGADPSGVVSSLGTHLIKRFLFLGFLLFLPVFFLVCLAGIDGGY